MITIEDVLNAGHVILNLDAGDQTAAVDELLASLHGDIRVLSREKLGEAVHAREPAVFESGGHGIVIAHGRTDSVATLVMAAGRTGAGLDAKGIAGKVRLVFVAGIPAAFNNDYLRVVGTIARVCSKPGNMDALLSAKDASTFISLLGGDEEAA